MQNGACITCKQKVDNTKIRALEKIKLILDRETFYDMRLSHYINFNFGAPERCKLGMACSEISRKNAEFRRLSNELSNKLSYYVEFSDFDNIFEILNLLRGYFPDVYRRLDIEYHKHKKD